jgi:hypothetical protein
MPRSTAAITITAGTTATTIMSIIGIAKTVPTASLSYCFRQFERAGDAGQPSMRHAGQLGEALKLDMAAHWQPTYARYFGACAESSDPRIRQLLGV